MVWAALTTRAERGISPNCATKRGVCNQSPSGLRFRLVLFGNDRQFRETRPKGLVQSKNSALPRLHGFYMKQILPKFMNIIDAFSIDFFHERPRALAFFCQNSTPAVIVGRKWWL